MINRYNNYRGENREATRLDTNGKTYVPSRRDRIKIILGSLRAGNDNPILIRDLVAALGSFSVSK